MINISNEFARELYNDNRNYKVLVVINLLDGTELTVNSDKLWGGSLKIEDSVSDDSHLEVGSVIINQLTVELNNIYDDFSTYDFTGAVLIPYVGLELSHGNELLKKGVFTADEVKYNGSLITIKAVDNMAKFDKAAVIQKDDTTENSFSFPNTLYNIVTEACSKCGVVFNTHDFPHKDYVVKEQPSEKSTTFREYIAYAAQIAGCFARCNTNGYLEFKWYDTLSLDWQSEVVDGGYFDDGEPYYESGEQIDGGVFNPWDDEESEEGDYDGGLFGDRDKIHFITSTYDFDLGVDDIVITGVRVTAKTVVVTNTGDEDGGNIMVAQTNGCDAAMNAKRVDYETQLTILQLQIIKLKNKKKKSTKQKNKLKKLQTEYNALNAEYQEYMESDDWSTLSDLEDLSANYESVVEQYGEDSPQALRALGELGDAYSSASFDPETFELENVSVYLQERDATVSYLAGEEGYVIEIEDNPFITEYTAQEIAYWIGERLIGVRYRKGTVKHQNDPSIEAGDIALVWDRKENSYPILISTTTFEVGSAQNTRSAGETPARNTAKSYSEMTKAYVENWDMLEMEKSDREIAVDELNTALNAKAGLYSTEEEAEAGGTIFYLHDKPRLEDSKVVWKMTVEAWGVSTDGGDTWNAGMTVDGDTIVRILTATGVNADWIRTGAFKITKRINGVDYELFYADADTGTLRIDGRNPQGNSMIKLDTGRGTFSLTGYATTSQAQNYADQALAEAKEYTDEHGAGDLTQEEVFDILTNNRQAQGLFLYGNDLYINAEYISGNTIEGINIFSKWQSTMYSDYARASLSDGQVKLYTQLGYCGTITGYNGTPVSGDPIVANVRVSSENYLFLEAGKNVNSSTIRTTSVGSSGKNVQVGSTGKLGYDGSSRRFKYDIQPIQPELDPHKILNIEVVQFKYKPEYDDPESERYLEDVPGFIAEQVNEFYPIIVDHSVDESGVMQCDSWNERYLIPPMLSLIQEQHSEIEDLKAKVAVQEERISRLEEIIENLAKGE